MQQKTFDLNNLNGINGFMVPGITSYGELGSSVSTTGDINGDGISDLVLGAGSPNYENGYAGASYVIFGSLGGFGSSFNLNNLNGINGFSVPGIATNSNLGSSVSTAGDINGDGISDLILGADGYAGASYVIFGSRNGFPSSFNLTTLNGTNGFSVPGVAANGELGLSVSTAGDINGDGLSDLVLGAPGTNLGNGTSYVLFGSRGGFPPSFNLTNLNGSNGFVVPGIAAGGYLGNSVNTAGDVNGDGIADLVLGAYVSNSGGTSYVLFGTRDGFSSSFNLTSLNGVNGFLVPGIVLDSHLGASVSTAGDINGDGISDLVLGDYLVNSATGASYVIFGSHGEFSSSFNLSNLNGTNGFTVPGVISGGYLGQSVSTAGDINGDGISDMVLGAYYANSGTGASYVIFGSREGFPPSFNLTNLNGINGFTVPGVVAEGYLGYAVNAAGDINGDGIDDLVLGACDVNGVSSANGASYVIFGKTPLVWVNNQMTITEGQRLLLTNAQLEATNLNNSTANLDFIVSDVRGGEFELVSNPGLFLSNFTQQQINSNQVYFVSDRTAPVSYDVSVIDGGFTLPATPADVTFIDPPPVVINPPLTQVVEPNQPFHFTLQANQLFNDSDGDPLTYSAKLTDGSPLPDWMYFDAHQLNELNFNGTAPSAGDTQISLSAHDPLNATVNTQFEILAQFKNGSTVNNNSLNVNSAEIVGAVVGGILGFGAFVGAGLGFWRYTANKNTRKNEPFADLIRTALSLKGVDDFDSDVGQKFVAAVRGLETGLQQAGVNPKTMRPLELRQLADDVADTARNKISSATDCLGRSVITVTDLNDNLQNLVAEVQALRSGGKQNTIQ